MNRKVNQGPTLSTKPDSGSESGTLSGPMAWFLLSFVRDILDCWDLLKKYQVSGRGETSQVRRTHLWWKFSLLVMMRTKVESSA